MYSQGENRSTVISATPAPTRRTNPDEMISTSKMDTCFNQREYSRFVTRYNERINANVGESKKPTGMAMIVKSSAVIKATLTGSFPEAMGRCFFTGWLRSASTSAISLNKYTALEIKQNK